jgi:hypothetical protein
MIIRGMNLPLIVACTFIVILLVIFPLLVSYRAENKKKNSTEWDKIKEYGNKINEKTRKNK